MTEDDVKRALNNVRAVEETRRVNAAHMVGCPLEVFLQNHEPTGISAVPRHWTKKDKRYLLDQYRSKKVSDIAAHLGRTEKATRQKAVRMGLTS